MKFFAVAWKDLQILLKDPAALVTLFLLPLVFIVVMTLALGGMFGGGSTNNPIKIPVANEDQGTLAQAVVEDLGKTKGFQVEKEGTEGQALTRAEVEKLVADGKRSLALVFPADFSQRLLRFEPTSIILILDPAASEQLVGPVRGTLSGLLQQQLMTTLAPVGIDLYFKETLPSLGPQGEVMKKRILEAMESFAGGSGQGGMASLVAIEETNPPGMTVKKYPTSIQHNAPGYTVMFVFFIVLTIAQSILTEKQEGTFRRLLAAPLSRAALLGGKLLPYYLVVLLQVAIMFAIGRLFFGMDLGEASGLVLVTLALAAAATSLGLLVAALGKTYAQVSGFATLAILLMAAVGGSMVPSFVMPQFMQDLARITPHFWAIAGYQDVLVRGLSLSEVALESGALLGFAVIFFGIALWRFRFD